MYFIRLFVNVEKKEKKEKTLTYYQMIKQLIFSTKIFPDFIR